MEEYLHCSLCGVAKHEGSFGAKQRRQQNTEVCTLSTGTKLVPNTCAHFAMARCVHRGRPAGAKAKATVRAHVCVAASTESQCTHDGSIAVPRSCVMA